MAAGTSLMPGTHVLVPWGFAEPRHGVVVDVWGDPPTQVRVRLDPLDDQGPTLLLLNPDVVTPAA